MKKINQIFKIKLLQRITLIISDIILFCIAAFLSLQLRFDFQEIPPFFISNLKNWLIVDATIAVLVFFFFGLYSSVWKYASVIELLRVIIACATSESISYIYKTTLHIATPTSYFIIHALLMMAFIGWLRYSYRIVKSVYISIADKFKTKKNHHCRRRWCW